MTEHAIVPLATEHVRDEFACGRPTLDDFLQRHADQNHRQALDPVTFKSSQTPSRLVNRKRSK